MPLVRVEPLGVEIDVQGAESLLDAAERTGLLWPTTCHGNAICTRCVIDVPEASRASFAPMRPAEREALERVRWRDGVARPAERLACQVRVLADAVVEKPFVRWRDR